MKQIWFYPECKVGRSFKLQYNWDNMIPWFEIVTIWYYDLKLWYYDLKLWFGKTYLPAWSVLDPSENWPRLVYNYYNQPFIVYSHSAWNNLPVDLDQPSHSLCRFKKKLEFNIFNTSTVLEVFWNWDCVLLAAFEIFFEKTSDKK